MHFSQNIITNFIIVNLFRNSPLVSLSRKNEFPCKFVWANNLNLILAYSNFGYYILLGLVNIL